MEKPALLMPECTMLAAVREYLAAGWALCAISENSKAPNMRGWNRRVNAITRQDQANQITGNVGLLHAYSGTVSIDVDDYNLAKPFLFSNGIDLDALINSPTSVLIDSGRVNRCKLLYSHPTPIQYKKLSLNGLELRCADTKGYSVQDVLPPSVHPNGSPYRWAGNGHFSVLPAIPQNVLDFWLNEPTETAVTGTQTIQEGSRNNALTSIAGKLRKEGKDEIAISDSLLAANKEQCAPPLPTSEVLSIAKSVCRYDQGDGIDDIGSIEEGDPLLPASDYLVRYQRHKIYRDMHGYGSKIVVWFAIADGDYQGSIVRAFYNIELVGEKWRAKPGSRFSREILKLFPDARKDRISPAMFKDLDILAHVGRTKKGTYSTVKELIETRL